MKLNHFQFKYMKGRVYELRRKYKKNIEVTLVSGPLPMPIYDDYSMISRRINLTKQKYNLHWLKLYKELSPLKFDEIVDFRSSIIGYFLRVKNLYPANSFFIK